MEQLNRIELRGLVGSVKVQDVSGRKVARLTVATNFAYKDRNGNAVIETTWHNVSAWEGRDICPLDKITRGDKVSVTGRVKNQKYTGSDGVERSASDIQASRLQLIEQVEPMQCEF
ncbi:MAG: single-stranded DNA-binding protein [Bacteroidales bacterium]|nr:single-stranded DNA-binding protein [Bacteroidales bacterium]